MCTVCIFFLLIVFKRIVFKRLEKAKLNLGTTVIKEEERGGLGVTKSTG